MYVGAGLGGRFGLLAGKVHGVWSTNSPALFVETFTPLHTKLLKLLDISLIELLV